MKRHEQQKSHNVTLNQQQQAQFVRVPRIVSRASWKKTVARVIQVHKESLAALADR